MEFYLVSALDELEEGKFGIREPRSDAPMVTDLSDALVIVPAFSFDRAGHRIGYGGGYYDRYLRAHKLRSVGVAYEEFLRDALPYDDLDAAVDTVVTEKRILQTQK